MRRDIIRDMELEADRQLRNEPGYLRHGFVYTDAFAVLVVIAIVAVVAALVILFW